MTTTARTTDDISPVTGVADMGKINEQLMQAQIDNLAAQTALIHAQAEEIKIRNQKEKASTKPSQRTR